MNIEELREFCLSLPHATEDIKWVDDLCFLIAGKMFCVADLQSPFKASFKVPDADFEKLTARPGIVPAPYFARAKWVLVIDESEFSRAEWEEMVTQSYTLVKQKLPKKLLTELGL